MRKFLGLSLVLGLLSSSGALAKTCELAIDSNDAMQFTKKELTVETGCTEVKLTLNHIGKLPKSAMGHNWVLTATADKNDVVGKAAAAGLAKDYIPESDKIIAHTKMIGGGETDSVTFKMDKLKKGGDYTFFCTFPGHAALMVGKLIVQ